MSEFAIATKVFTRTEELQGLLESVPQGVDTVYVGDDGETESRKHLYEREWWFTLEVLDLPFDAGLATGRNRIVEESSEDYLFFLDTDHRVPSNYEILVKILENDHRLGAVSGMIQEERKKTGLFHDIKVDENILFRYFDGNEIRINGGRNVYIFDFIPNAAVFRRECLEDQMWDGAYTIGMEHLDFYLSHLDTEWDFGVCEEVAIPHTHARNEEYSSHRLSEEKLSESESHFQDKWGIDHVVMESSWKQDHHGICGRFPVRMFPFSILKWLCVLDDHL